MSLCYDFEKWTIISLASVAISLTIGLVLMQCAAHGQEWNTTGQIEQDIHNFTRTAQNGTQYICQENSAGQVLGCSLISGSQKAIPVNAKGQAQEKFNAYFSIRIPDSWTYTEYSHTPEATTTGFGPGNQIWLTPSEFSDILLTPDFEKYSKKIEDGA